MDLRLRRAMGMLKLGRAVDAAEAAAEAGQEAGQPPLAAVTVAARVAAAGAKSLCEGEAEEEALDELTALKVPVALWSPLLKNISLCLDTCAHVSPPPSFSSCCSLIYACSGGVTPVRASLGDVASMAGTLPKTENKVAAAHIPSSLSSCLFLTFYLGVFHYSPQQTQHDLEGVIASSSTPGESGVGPDAEEVAAQTSALLTLTVAEAVAWRRRVMSSLVNSFVGRGNWRLALALLEEMGKEQCGTGALAATGGAAESHPPAVAATDDALRVEVLSRIGRVFLQFGSLEDAEVYFRRAEEAAAVEGAREDNPRVSHRACCCQWQCCHARQGPLASIWYGLSHSLDGGRQATISNMLRSRFL